MDFSTVDIRSFCFFGDCEFENTQINTNHNYDEIIGQEIIQFTKARDITSFSFRKKVKATQSINGGALKYVFWKKGEKKRTTLKYFHTANIFYGLASFYHSMSRECESKGEYALAGIFQYYFSYSRDEADLYRNRLRSKSRMVINRHLLGYGWRFGETIKFLLLMTVGMSFLYLFTGVEYNDVEVRRLAFFDLSQLFPTINDWLRCLYFSLKTTTNVGHGNFLPVSAPSLIASFIQGCIGFIVFTIFVVIFSRRFFK
jgi:hypothetical protein